MPSFDYWDVDEILAEQHPVSVRPQHDVAGGGLLHPSNSAGRDLRQGTKVQVPLWLGVSFLRRHAASMELPTMLAGAAQEDLQRDPVVCRVGEKSRHFFEVGLRVAHLLGEPLLADDLLNAAQRRWAEVVTLVASSSVGSCQASNLNPDSLLFPSTLTDVEQEMLQGGREAEMQSKQWSERFAGRKMRASYLAEAAPAAKRQRVG